MRRKVLGPHSLPLMSKPAQATLETERSEAGVSLSTFGYGLASHGAVPAVTSELEDDGLRIGNPIRAKSTVNIKRVKSILNAPKRRPVVVAGPSTQPDILDRIVQEQKRLMYSDSSDKKLSLKMDSNSFPLKKRALGDDSSHSSASNTCNKPNSTDNSTALSKSSTATLLPRLSLPNPIDFISKSDVTPKSEPKHDVNDTSENGSLESSEDRVAAGDVKAASALANGPQQPGEPDVDEKPEPIPGSCIAIENAQPDSQVIEAKPTRVIESPLLKAKAAAKVAAASEAKPHIPLLPVINKKRMEIKINFNLNSDNSSNSLPRRTVTEVAAEPDHGKQPDEQTVTNDRPRADEAKETEQAAEKPEQISLANRDVDSKPAQDDKSGEQEQGGHNCDREDGEIIDSKSTHHASTSKDNSKDKHVKLCKHGKPIKKKHKSAVVVPEERHPRDVEEQDSDTQDEFPVQFSEKVAVVHNDAEDEDKREFKKSSASSKNRSYRDGKVRDDEVMYSKRIESTKTASKSDADRKRRSSRDEKSTKSHKSDRKRSRSRSPRRSRHDSDRASKHKHCKHHHHHHSKHSSKEHSKRPKEQSPEHSSKRKLSEREVSLENAKSTKGNAKDYAKVTQEKDKSTNLRKLGSRSMTQFDIFVDESSKEKDDKTSKSSKDEVYNGPRTPPELDKANDVSSPDQPTPTLDESMEVDSLLEQNNFDSIKSPNSDSSDVYDPAAPIDSPASTEDIPLPPPPPKTTTPAKNAAPPQAAPPAPTTTNQNNTAQLLATIVRSLVPVVAATSKNVAQNNVPPNSLLAQIAQTMSKQQHNQQKAILDQLSTLITSSNHSQLPPPAHPMSAVERAAELAQQGRLPGVDGFVKPAAPAASHHRPHASSHRDNRKSGHKSSRSEHDDVPNSAVELNNRERVRVT